MVKSEISNKNLKKRIIDLSFKHNLSHLGSCLTAVDIIKDIYDIQQPGDKFILDQGHAHLAHLVVQESLGILDAAEVLNKYGIHCDVRAGCDCSTGSLGLGLGIGLGMAIGNPEVTVRILTSDGALAEGIAYETLNTRKKYKVDNFCVYVNCNGFEGYGEVSSLNLPQSELLIYETNINYLPFLNNLDGHYLVMNYEQYKEAISILS